MIQSLAGGGLVLPGLLSELLADSDSISQAPHFTPKAKRVIFLFMTGGVSHIDSFDPKPALSAAHDQPHTKHNYYKGADWNFRRYGQCGTEVSDLFPHMGSMMDKICLIRSMQNINGDHFGATIGIHTGSATFNRPSMGSWVSYGLGAENANLPAFMVLSSGLPYGGAQSWGSDFLPVRHQGTRIVPGANPIANLKPNETNPEVQRTGLDLLQFLNRQHLSARAHDSTLAARIKSFETAYGMQVEAPEAFDLRQESDAVHSLYGLERGETTGFAWQCLVARRLAQRGVRFIELIDGDTSIDNNWDAHANMGTYNRLARNVDRPIAGLLKDLESLGMLDDTLVVWTTEFGRSPFCQSPGTDGRGHHSRAYSSWLAGAGVRGGMVHGASDDLGNHIASDRVTAHDFQATILHLLGIDHERLTYRHAGRDFRLTDVHGHVVQQILS